MRFLVFGGGLGNQIFEYAYYLYLKKKYPSERFYGFYKIRLNGHNGLEINKRFKINLPPSNLLSDFCVYLLYLIKKINPAIKILDLDIYDFNERAILHNALKIDKKIIPNNVDWLPFNIEESKLSQKNQIILGNIRSTRSCFIHVRRGDYVTGVWKSHYEGCCPLSYYESSISDIKRHEPNIKFFCFSDDIEWMKENLPIPDDSYYIDWNKGEDSFIDMFLMSQCTFAIMANSTFSYWAAVLGKKKERVYYPIKWENTRTPDIFYPDWISY